MVMVISFRLLLKPPGDQVPACQSLVVHVRAVHESSRNDLLMKSPASIAVVAVVGIVIVVTRQQKGIGRISQNLCLISVRAPVQQTTNVTV